MKKALVMLAVVMMGCGPDFDPGSLISKPRLLAAKLQVVDEPGVAWPAPGQEVTIEWLAVDPVAPQATYDWAFGTCIAAPTLSGGQLCQQAPFGFVQDTGSAPSYELRVPTEDTLAGASALLVAGVVCGRGRLVFNASGGFENLEQNPNVLLSLDDVIQCVGDSAERMLVTFVVPIKKGEQNNQHPDLGGVSMAINNQSWPAVDGMLDPTQSCAELQSQGVPSIARDQPEVILQQYFQGAEREYYENSEMPDQPQREVLQLSQFTTAGELDRQFTVIEDDAPDEVWVEIKWKLPQPQELPEEDFLVQFYFVGRDLRGGSDWTLRSICIPTMLQ